MRIDYHRMVIVFFFSWLALCLIERKFNFQSANHIIVVTATACSREDVADYSLLPDAWSLCLRSPLLGCKVPGEKWKRLAPTGLKVTAVLLCGQFLIYCYRFIRNWIGRVERDDAMVARVVTIILLDRLLSRRLSSANKKKSATCVWWLLWPRKETPFGTDLGDDISWSHTSDQPEGEKESGPEIPNVLGASVFAKRQA